MSVYYKWEVQDAKDKPEERGELLHAAARRRVIWSEVWDEHSGAYYNVDESYE
jgi:hypothetical protein